MRISGAVFTRERWRIVGVYVYVEIVNIIGKGGRGRGLNKRRKRMKRLLYGVFGRSGSKSN